jgi:hypothetical protein
MFKSDIINGLGTRHGFTSYLEICTPTTGYRYGKVDRRQFTTCQRLMYRWCVEACDGLRIDYAVEGEAIESVAADLRRRGQSYDLILVDPWHGYEASLRDMRLALTLLKDGGALVVHDCAPPSLDFVAPVYVVGDWCGMTYAAFVDFLAQEPSLEAYTVDADFGCAVVRRGRPNRKGGARLRPDPAALTGWQAAGPDHADRFRYFDRHRAELLNLISIEEFQDREGLPSATQGWRSAWRRAVDICS